MTATPKTFEANGRLWGTRAAAWASIQEPVNIPLFEAVLNAAEVRSGTRYLDVGCGSGLAIQMADALGAQVTGLDASQELLKIASTRTPNAALHCCDLEELPFEDATFDVVSGINSFQYAGNPVSALSDARRVVADNGKVVIVTWGEPEGMEAAKLVGAIKPLLPPPPPGAPGPFALSDETALRQFAEKAGLETIKVFDVELPFRYPDMETAVRGMSSAGVAVKAMDEVGESAVEGAHRRAFLEFQQSDGSISVSATFRCLVAKPREN